MARRRRTRDRAAESSRERRAPASPAARRQGEGERLVAADALLAALAALASLAVFANAARGDFVYDDDRQIVRNTLIQDPSRLGRALLSDVWAFKGGTGAVSNYWRPTFVGWLVLQHRLFGLGATLPWHLASDLLHAGVTVLAFLLARRLRLPRAAAAAVALVFAVHPAHSESVAWISGSPDLLLGAALLGALLLLLAPRPLPSWRLGLALILHALALGAKEVAVVFPVIAALAADPGRAAGTARARRMARAAAPFALLAAVYLVARALVLGGVGQVKGGGLTGRDAVLSAPLIVLFYLRQIVFPAWIGPSYPLRAVTPATLGVANFVLPLLACAALAGGAAWLARRSAAARLGAALLLPLLPALHIGAFQPEQIVHDRYLYLPLLGFLLLALPEAAARAPRLGPAIALAACAPLSLQTVRANRAWLSDVALWERGVAIDPASAFTALELGAALEGAGRHEEAARALERALALNPAPPVHLAHARAVTALGRHDEAERELDAIVRSPVLRSLDDYSIYQLYESLAIARERQRKLPEAAATLAEARTVLPGYAAALTDKRAVVLHEQGDLARALAELEAARSAARAEPLPESRAVLFHLGVLYGELRRPGDARAALADYLEASAGLDDPATRDMRARARAALATGTTRSPAAGTP